MNIASRPPDAALATPAPVPARDFGAFTRGSTLRHVLVMTAAGSAGLVAVFFVDFLTLLYISRLGDTNLTAAVGYASQMIFLLISVNIGMSIALGALVSRALGAGDRPRARRIAASGLVHDRVGLRLREPRSRRDALHPPRSCTLFGARGEALNVGLDCTCG